MEAEQRRKIVLSLSERMNSILNEMRTKYQLPEDIEVEVNFLSAFKNILTLLKEQKVAKEEVETYVTVVLNEYLMSAGLDLYITKVSYQNKPQLQ